MNQKYILLFFSHLFIVMHAFPASPEIKLTARKGHLLAIPVRDSVLVVADQFLSPADQGFMAEVESLESPYGEELEEVAVAAAVVVTEEQAPEPVEVPVHYDDASVLEVIATKFAKQVRGTLEKGGRSYLQLQGGGLLKSGTSFPVKVPEVEDQTFTVTVSDITSRGYTLTMGESTLPVSFNASTGVTKDARE